MASPEAQLSTATDATDTTNSTDLPTNNTKNTTPITFVEREAQIHRALAAIRSKESSVRQASILYRVPRSTLHHRLRGTKSHAEAMEPYQRVTPAQEACIVRAANQMQIWGWPLTTRVLDTFANHYLKVNNDTKPLGKQWYNNFLVRHPELKLQRGRCVDPRRTDEASCKSLKNCFETYQQIRLAYHIADEDACDMPDEDNYYMDEKGLMKGVGDDAKVVISRTDILWLVAQ